MPLFAVPPGHRAGRFLLALALTAAVLAIIAVVARTGAATVVLDEGIRLIGNARDVWG